MSAPTPPRRSGQRLHRPRTVALLGALVVLVGLVELAAQPSAPEAGVPLAAAGCAPTTAEPEPGAPGTLPARIRADYRPAPAAAGAAAGGAPADEVSVVAVLESVGQGVSYDVGPCQSVAATLYGSLPDGTTVHGSVDPGRRTVAGSGGGEVVLVDSATGARALHGGRQGFEGFSGWYGVMADPAPGTYGWSSDVVWTTTDDPSGGPLAREGPPVGRGRVSVTLVLGGPPHVPGGA